MTQRVTWFGGYLAPLALIFFPTSGWAAADANASSADTGATLQEVVVTAQRRSENLQNVPISVVALSGGELVSSGVNDIRGLMLVAPSLNFSQEAGWLQPHMRGVGTTATGPGIENSIALYVDGVYYAAMIGANLSLNSTADVEAINGPQGTLFGRNATGGLIQIRTKDPSHDFEGFASVGYGNYQTAYGSAYITGGITDTLAADFAVDGQYQHQGYGINITTGHESDRNSPLFVRTKWLYTPNDDLKVTFAGDYNHIQFNPALQPAPGTAPPGGAPPQAPHDISGFYNPGGIVNAAGAALTIDYDLHPIHLLSISAYRNTQSDTMEGGTGSLDPNAQFGITLVEPHVQFSQELQLYSPAGGFVTWVAGAYFFHETAKYDPVHLFGSLLLPASDVYYYTTAKTDSYALYGQTTFALSSATHLTTGIRYTVEPRSVSIANPVLGPGGVDFGTTTTDGSKTFTAPSWRLSLDHRFNEELMAYASYNRGFKSGGWNPAQLPAVSFEPEKLDAFEVGLKSDLLGDRLRINVSPFYYKYQNVQVQSFQNGILLISNGAEGKIYGIDFAAEARFSQNFTLRAGTTVLHSEFTSYPDADITTPIPGGGTAYGIGSATGNPLPLAPNVIVSVGFEYAIPSAVGQFKINGDYAYNSGWNAEPDGRLKQPSYSVVNGQLAWLPKAGKYEIALWGKNLSNTNYATSIFSQSIGDQISWAPPRTYGVNCKVNF